MASHPDSSFQDLATSVNNKIHELLTQAESAAAQTSAAPTTSTSAASTEKAAVSSATAASAAAPTADTVVQVDDHAHGYPTLQIIYHWVMVFLVIYAYYTVFTGQMNNHITVGKWIFHLAVIRVFLWIIYWKRRPPINPPLKLWQQIPRWFVKAVLLLIFVQIPMMALIGFYQAGNDIWVFFTIIEGHQPANLELAHSIFSVHRFLGFTALLFIGVHALAGLYHHFVRKDNTLKNMLP